MARSDTKRLGSQAARAVFALAALVSLASAQAGRVAPQPTPTPAPEALSEPEHAPAESERAAVRSVSVIFTAYDKADRPVTTLRREDVRLVEDGNAVADAELRVQRDAPLFLAVVIDTSESQRDVLGGTKLAADIFVTGMMRPGKDRAAVVTFSGEVTLEQAMTADVAHVRGAIMLVKPANPSGINLGITTGPLPRMLLGSSAVWDSVWVVSNEVLPRSLGAGRRAVILITDGVDTSSLVKLDDAVRAALGSEAIVYAVGVTSRDFDADRDALRKLAERTGGRAFFPKKVGELTDIFTRIQEELLSHYVLTFTPPAKARDGSFRKLKVELVNPELKRQGVRLSFPHGYFVGNAPTALPARP